MRRVNRRTAQRLQNRNPSPSALVSRILSEKNKRATCSRTAHSGRIVGYSYLIPVTSPATRAGDSTMGLETQPRKSLRLIDEQIAQLDQEMANLLRPHQAAVERLAEVPGLGV